MGPVSVRPVLEEYRRRVEAAECVLWDRVSLPVRAQGVNRADVLQWLGRDSLRGVYWLQVPTSEGARRVFAKDAPNSWEDVELADRVGGAGAVGQMGRDANETWQELAASLGRLAAARDVASGRADVRTRWLAFLEVSGPLCCDGAGDAVWQELAGEPVTAGCTCTGGPSLDELAERYGECMAAADRAERAPWEAMCAGSGAAGTWRRLSVAYWHRLADELEGEG